MTFRKGLYTGIALGLLLVSIGAVSINKIMNDSEKIETIDLQKLKYKNLSGEEVKLSDYGGDKNILINFWATWCVPCVKEFPMLDKIYDALEDDFIFIVVSDEPIDKVSQFASKKAYKFTYLKTEEFLLNGITSVPQTFILNKELEKKKYHPEIFEGDPVEIADSIRMWVQ